MMPKTVFTVDMPLAYSAFPLRVRSRLPPAIRAASTGCKTSATTSTSAYILFARAQDQLGEANTLQGLGLLALTQGDAAGAFRRFGELPAIYEAIQDRVGRQAALGYMARAGAALGEPDRALLLAGESLRIGRDILDRFGQTITLELMLGLFQANGDQGGLLAALTLYRDLLEEIRDEARLGGLKGIWQQLEKQLPPSQLERLQAEAPVLLDAALAAARGRFGEGDPHRLD